MLCAVWSSTWPHGFMALLSLELKNSPLGTRWPGTENQPTDLRRQQYHRRRYLRRGSDFAWPQPAENQTTEQWFKSSHAPRVGSQAQIGFQISNSRCRSPLRTASARVTAPSLRNSDSTWNLTVCWEMPSRRAAALLLRPSAIAANTSVSRGVNSGTSSSSSASNDGEGRAGTRTINPQAAASSAASI